MLQKYTHHNTRESGQSVIIAVILFSFGSFIFIGGITSTILADIQEVNTLMRSKQSFYLSEGSLEDIVYRVQNGITVSSVETLSIDGYSATTTVTDIAGGKSISALGDTLDLIRKSQVDVIEGSGASFFYGMQAGEGGVIFENNSFVSGNLFSNGPVTGENNNLIKGTLISAGPNGIIDGVHSTSSVFSHTIQNSLIEGDAYFETIDINTTVSGTKFPGSADQATTSLPISDSQISGWETDAEAGGVISSPCPYEISDDTIIGPVKITCDLLISSSPTVTLMGSVWVTGNILIENSAVIRVSPSIGSKSIPIIADNPADRLTSSNIKIKNNAIFQGSGTPGSYILFISQNNSAENVGTEKAIEILNNGIGDLLVYAPHGEIQIENNAMLREVTGYRIRLKNNAEVIYESGLSSLLFTTGPSGGFEILSWKEIE